MASERRLHPLSFLFAIQESAKRLVFPAVVALFAARNRDAWELWAGLFVPFRSATASNRRNW